VSSSSKRFSMSTNAPCCHTYPSEIILHKRPRDACVLSGVPGVTRTYRPPFHLNPRSGEAPSDLDLLAFRVELVYHLLTFFQRPVAAVLCWQSVVSLTRKYSTSFLTYAHRAADDINHFASVVRLYVAFAIRMVVTDDLADTDASGCVHLAFVT
jgi:hypothetical protein